MFGAAAITIHSINGYRRRQPVWKKRLSRTRASEGRESRRLRSDFAAKTSVILSDMNRFCAAQSRAKSTVKKLPGGVDFPKNRWIRHFLKELPMGLRSRWHVKAAHRFQFQGVRFTTRSTGSSARSDRTLSRFFLVQKLLTNSPVFRLSPFSKKIGFKS